MVDATDRSQFLRLAAVFEGGLVFVALGLGLVFRINPFAEFRVEGTAIALGIAAALPPFLLLVVTDRFRFSALERIKRIVLQLLGPSLIACRWYELVAVAALAGFGEELVFRGVLQRLFERWLDFGGSGPIAGLVASNVIFGLLHCLTPTYGVLAALMGIYFGVLLDATHPPSVVAPILAHGLYDYLAFLLLRRAARTEAIPGQPSSSPTAETVPSETSTSLTDSAG
ncbi:MAG TPA: CPBP family intramembrane glutamic endopeptidase [Planctomycetaceae bacterium]|jgi:membrane protease YdiL (CAAX protease family)|nr:CPBP family intramembrane glutamic endopeptidase [Planctomycetaceae bacterium]